jgi:YHS domain-containing protein
MIAAFPIDFWSEASEFRRFDRHRGLGVESLQFRPIFHTLPDQKNTVNRFTFSMALAVLCWPGGLHAQQKSVGEPYRITPPLRVAQRYTAGAKPTTSDPFKPSDPNDRPRVTAIEGYCLVTLKDHGRWVPGDRAFTAIRDDKFYFFASPRERDIFLAKPERYVPVLDGDCIVNFAETGERIPGNLQMGMFFQERLFFFKDQESLERFQTDPEVFLNADLIDDGRCVVSKVAEHRDVAGIPETVAIVRGRRYFFASAFHRKVFLASPQHFGLDGSAVERLAVSVPDAGKLGPSGMPQFGNPNVGAGSVVPEGFKNQVSTGGKKAVKKDGEEAPEKMENRAMAGYCPVSIKTQGTWQRGKSSYKSTFDGKVYFLVGPEELAAFKSNQLEFVPVLGGDSVLNYADDYERVPGSVFHAVQYQGRLYLFANVAQSKRFAANKDRYANADLASQGNCVVSGVDDKQEIAGSADFETLYLGLRYRFASQEYLDKFLASPKTYAEQ